MLSMQSEDDEVGDVRFSCSVGSSICVKRMYGLVGGRFFLMHLWKIYLLICLLLLFWAVVVGLRIKTSCFFWCTRRIVQSSLCCLAGLPQSPASKPFSFSNMHLNLLMCNSVKQLLTYRPELSLSWLFSFVPQNKTFGVVLAFSPAQWLWPVSILGHCPSAGCKLCEWSLPFPGLFLIVFPIT